MKIAQAISSAITITFALIIGIWTISAYANSSSFSQEWTLEGDIVLDKELSVSEPLTMVLRGRDSLTLLPGTTARLEWDEDISLMNVFLESGAVFFATRGNDFRVSVYTDIVRVDSQESLAFVKKDAAGDVSVYGLSHPSLLTFTKEGEDLNALFVPDGTMIDVQKAKVTSTLKRLRLTKLSKEFQVKDWNPEDLDEKLQELWNVAKERYERAALNYMNDLQSNLHFGPSDKGMSAVFSSFYRVFREKATLLSIAKKRLEKSTKNTILNYAMSNLLFGDAQKGLSWLMTWQEMDHDLSDLESKYSDLFFVLPGDELYPVKTAVISLVFEKDSNLLSLRRSFLEVESLLAKGSYVEAQSTLQDYSERVVNALKSGVFDDVEMSSELGREYLLLERLLKKNVTFYDLTYMEVLSQMEDKILDLADDETDISEERQAFVLGKIQFLNKIFDAVVAKKIPVSQAKDLANELLLSAEAYMKLIPSNVAVLNYYESELKKAELAIKFIASPEFYSYKDFDEGLKAYAAKEQDLADLQAYIQEIRIGNQDSLAAEITLDEAIEEVRQALSFEAISYLNAESQGDAGYRLFDIIGGKVDQYSFKASYDREGRLFYDLVIDDQIRFSTGVLLSDLRDVIEQAYADQPLEEDIEYESPEVESSLTDNLAVAQVESAFEAEGLDINDFDFDVLDRDAGLFSFEGIITQYRLPVQGVYNLKDRGVSELKWWKEESEQFLPDMDLSRLEAAIKAVYEALNAN